MNQTARIEMWTCLAQEAAAVASAWLDQAVGGVLQPSAGLALRMAALRGQVRGLDPERLPFPAWDAGKAFLRELAAMLDEERTPVVRCAYADEVASRAASLVEILATSAHRPRADLDD